jgi:hypothetical protein
MADNAIVENTGPLHPVKTAEENIVASVPKEAFKAMFYLFAGKPDSRIKLYKRKIKLIPDDLEDLNKKIRDKLSLHNIEQIISTCVLDFEGDDIVEFGTWAELESYDWKNSNITNTVTLKWDFMIKLDEFAAPQRHTLTVRVASPMKPQEMLRIMVSGGVDDIGDMDHRAALCTGRVDFISHVLADELLAVVNQWNKTLRQPNGCTGLLPFLEKFDNWIARGVHLLFPVICVFLSIAVLDFFNRVWVANNTTGHESGILIAKWLLISIAGIYAALRISKFIASKIYHKINEYGAYRVFHLTRGDENAEQQAVASNIKALRGFWLHSLIAVVLNLIAAIAAWYILPNAGR